MTADLKAEQGRQWRELHDQIKGVLQQYGAEWDSCQRKGDYLLVDDNMGWYQHKIELQNLSLFRPAVVKALQRLLAGFPDWEVVVAMDIPDKKNDWPAMGVIIRDNEIIDGLQRQYFPREFQDIAYEGSRPMGSRFSDVTYSTATSAF
jgi:hypothetical protein